MSRPSLLWFVLWLVAVPVGQVRAEQVDVELVLAVDVSGSMSPHELRLQRRGYAEALRSDAVWSAIEGGLIGSVAIIYVEWARDDLKKVIVPWSKISTRKDANHFADRLLAAEYENMRRTSISGATAYGQRQIAENTFDGLRKVIDISGDGPNNQGGLVTLARDEAVEAGIVINGLPIVVTGQVRGRYSFFGDLEAYYRACVIGGPGAFVIPVVTWEGFGEAVRRKLVLELAGGEPSLTGSPKIWRIANDIHNSTDCEIGEKLRFQWLNDQ